jgi:hypothetical protein
MKTMNKAMLWVVLVMAVGFFVFPQQTMGWLFPSGGDEITADMNRTILRIDEGLT